MAKQQIVLASRSPRRRELLEKIGIRDFLIEEAGIDEAAVSRGCMSCAETVTLLARAKAEEVSARHPDAVVIGSDTAVTIDGRILGKPADFREAQEMLRLLSGREHQVMSGVCVCAGGQAHCACEITAVQFRELTDREIDAYIDAEPPFDKAGAYGIQGLAALFVERISGDYYNVMGLPLCRLGSLLRSIGFPLL